MTHLSAQGGATHLNSGAHCTAGTTHSFGLDPHILRARPLFPNERGESCAPSVPRKGNPSPEVFPCDTLVWLCGTRSPRWMQSTRTSLLTARAPHCATTHTNLLWARPAMAPPCHPSSRARVPRTRPSLPTPFTRRPNLVRSPARCDAPEPCCLPHYAHGACPHPSRLAGPPDVPRCAWRTMPK